MTWIIPAVSVIAVACLGLVLVGVVRELDRLRRRLDLVEKAFPGKINRRGLPVGAKAPEFTSADLAGRTVSTTSYVGDQYLVLFAHPGCAPCDDLVPPLAAHVVKNQRPRTIVVSQGATADHRGAWRPGNDSSDVFRVVLQQHSAIAKQFETFITPHLFVVNPDGRIGAQGVANSVEEVRVLLKEAEVARRKSSPGRTDRREPWTAFPNTSHRPSAEEHS